MLKKIIPTIVLDFFRKYRYNSRTSPFNGKSVKEVFTSIYSENTWGSHVSRSGPGSTEAQSANIVKMINELIDRQKIKSILDLPCGDFNWMKRVSLSDVDYVGGDIVEELIENNIKNFRKDNINFRHLDIINDDLPRADLIIVRDCFVHFSYQNILKSIENIKRSECKYILTTTFTKQRVNYDIVTGDWRPINLLHKPFNLPKPLVLTEENYAGKFKKDYRGKSLALWEIADLKLSPIKPKRNSHLPDGQKNTV